MSTVENKTAIVGSSYTLKCLGTNLTTSDIVWLYYPTGNSSFTSIIYSDGDYTSGSKARFEINSRPTSVNKIETTLLIRRIQVEDSLLTYQCACNVYKEACSSGVELVDEVNIVAVTTTTSKN